MTEKHVMGRRRAMATIVRGAVGTGLAWPALGGAAAASAREHGAPKPARPYPLSACDWSIGCMGKTSAFERAKRIGLDGVQVSLGTKADGMKLRRPDVQKEYLAASKATGVAISSVAIGDLNNVPYKSAPETEEWVADSIDVCRALGCRVVLLAFFGKGELKGDKAGIDEVVKRLRRVAPKAEKAGVILGLETYLDAREHLDIIDRVGSSAVQVYYDVANSNHKGYDIYEEIPLLGKRICEIHAKENGFLLGKGRVDFPRVRKQIEKVFGKPTPDGKSGYQGWLVIEGAVPGGAGMMESYVKNREYLQGVFGV